MSIKAAEELPVHVWKVGVSILFVLALTTFLSFCIETDRQHTERMDRMREWLKSGTAKNSPLRERSDGGAVPACGFFDSLRA